MNPINRRSFLGFLAAIAATPLTKGLTGIIPDGKEPFNAAIDRQLLDFLGEGTSRPDHVWFDREDLIYHDYSFPPEVESHPDFWVFTRKRVIVFNRAMEWLRDAQHGTIINYCSTSELVLTGINKVSAWHTSPPNLVEHSGDFTHFVKNSRWQRDCVVLPAFQFHIDQNPVLELDVTDADSDWQFCVSIKGRGGPPVFSSSWKNGQGKIFVDLKKILKDRGYDFQFAELHFAIGLWSPLPDKKAGLKFRLGMPSRDVIIANLPVIRTIDRAKNEGLPLATVAVNKEGKLLGSDKIRLVAVTGGMKYPLTESNGVWRGLLQGLQQGNHTVIIESDKGLIASIQTIVRVTTGEFFRFDKSSGWIKFKDKPVGPLSGSYQGTFYFKNAGLSDEAMVQGQSAWDAWDRTTGSGEHMHYWEALTRKELEERFSFLAASGFDLLTLHSHWGLWERLDAGGRISPHAGEQLSLYLRTADKYGLAHIQALSSGPYGIPVDDRSGYGDTVPFSRYLEEGFKKEDWFNPEGRFNELFHQYITDFTTLFRDETALFGMTASGEGDFIAPDRANDIFRQIKEEDPNHIMLSEPINLMDKLPEKICSPYAQDMRGGRTYFIAENETFPEFDLGVEFKLYKTVGNVYLAEGSWPPMPGYDLIHAKVFKDGHGTLAPWAGTSMYRIRLRDTLYLGLIHRLAVMNTWDEEMTENEHLLIKEIRGKVDWNQRFIKPDVAIIVDDECAGAHSMGRENLARYERAFTSIPLDYRMYTANDSPSDALVVIDGRKPFEAPEFKSEGGILPDEIRKNIPVKISGKYSAGYTISEDRSTLLAYFYNTSEHQTEKRWLAGNTHRIPKTSDFSLKVTSLAAKNLRYTLYDLNENKICKEVLDSKGPEWSFKLTDHDFFLLVTPA